MPVLSPKRQVTLPKELCDRLRVRPGDQVEFLEHNGRITILKKTRGASAGVLRHLKADARFSDEASLRDALAGRREGYGQEARRVIAVDTDVLLRRLLNDDATQAEKARRLFEMQESVLVTDVVLAEAIWTLTGKRYGAGKEELAAVVMGLLEEGNVVFESRQAVWSALNDYLDALPVKTASGVRTADLPDALVVSKAKVTAQQRNEPYGGTYTYDQAALALEGTKAP